MRTKLSGFGFVLALLASAGCGGGDDSGAKGGGGAGAGAGAGGSGGSGGGPVEACTPDEERACYDGPAGTKGVGMCKAGTRKCRPDGSGFGDCDGQVLPKKEDCSKRGDEDCDGSACSDAIWDRVAGDAQDQYAWRVAIDDTDNTYAFGRFKGTMDLGGGPVTAQGEDLFLAKFNKSGALLWLNTFPGVGDAPYPRQVVLGPDGRVAIGGLSLGSRLTFGSTIVDGTTEEVGFVALFDADGHQQGAYPIRAQAGAEVSALSYDTDGNLYVAGSFSGPFDDCTVPGCPTNVGKIHGYLRKLDPSGTPLWTNQYGDAGSSAIVSLAARHDGTVLVAGTFTISMTLDGTTHQSQGGTDIFLASMGDGGVPLWALTLGSAGEDAAHLAARSDGSFTIGGTASGELELDGVSTGASAGGPFVFSFDASGKGKWAKSFGDNPVSLIQGLAHDGAGNLLIGATTDLGSIDIGGKTYTNQDPTSDAFLVKLAPGGALQWSKAFAGKGTQGAPCVAANKAGRIAFGVGYQNKIDFGLGPHTANNADGTSGLDLALANFQP